MVTSHKEPYGRYCLSVSALKAKGGEILQSDKDHVASSLNASPDTSNVVEPTKLSPQIEDVARQAGVSIATVSYVINGRGRVSPKTRARVHKVIEELNYTPSARGRSLALGHAQTVGLLADPNLASSDGFAPLVRTLTLLLLENGYHLLLLAGEVEGDLKSLEEAANSGRVDGAVALALSGETLTWSRTIQIPLVLIGSVSSGSISIDTDHRTAATLAASHLCDLGHQRIALIKYPSPTAKIWENACKDVIERASGTLVCVMGPRDFRGGYEATMSLLSGIARPTGLVIMDDSMAEGSLAAATNLGIGVPEQLSIVGYGDSHHASQAIPPITTISPRWEDLGEQAGRSMLRALAGEDQVGATVSPILLVRGSTAPAGSFATPDTALDELVIKSGPAFTVWSEELAIRPVSGRHGIYIGDTRIVSLYQARVDGKILIPDTLYCGKDYIRATYVVKTPASTLRIARSITIFPDHLDDQWSWQSWGPAYPWSLELSIASDFQDIFAIRGMNPSGQGSITTHTEHGSQHITYTSRDGVENQVTVSADRPTDQSSELGWRWTIPPLPLSDTLHVTVAWTNPVISLEPSPEIQWPSIETANASWNLLLKQSQQDIDMLTTAFSERGFAPMAGLPWFGTLFGRDAIITGLETLTFVPELSMGIAYALAQLQGTEFRSNTEEEPGKIIHELRLGEMARLGEVPFGRYYGSVDSTPLFVTLVTKLWFRTADREFLREMLPVVDRAVEWIRSQRTVTGLFEFLPSNGEGLLIQSWKDSSDSMVFADGTHGVPPLAVAEVQGYVYQAFTSLAKCYRSIGQHEEADLLEFEAESVQRAFHKAFWLEERGYYALAVDGKGRQLDSLSSDPGQCLWTGIVPKQFQEKTANVLLSPPLFSGWGVRTLSSIDAAYDPYSYHRGSVWPHDTALIVSALRSSGQFPGTVKLANALLDAGASFPNFRLPELFAGEERGVDGPLPYPGACSPQSWAAASPWLVMATLFGIEVDAVEKRISFSPLQGNVSDTIKISHLAVGDSYLDLEFNGTTVDHSGLPEGWTLNTDPP